MDRKKSNEYIFIFSLLSSLINIILIWQEIPSKNNTETFFALIFCFSTYFIFFYLIYFFLSVIYHRLPYLSFFLFFFFLFSFYPETFPENLIYLFLLIIFSLSLLSTNLFESFFSYKIPKNSYPIIYFLSFFFIFILKIFEKKLSFYYFLILSITLFIAIIIFILISNLLKIPSFFYPVGILFFLIFFFISFFYFFPFTPLPYERKGQNFLLITVEGLRSDFFEKMPYLNKFKEKGAYFSSFYLFSPDYKKNLEKLFYQKGKFLLDFYPERYEKISITSKELKDLDILSKFEKKIFFKEKDFYSMVISNWLFLKFFKRERELNFEEIFNISFENIEKANKPFFIWLHIDKLKYSIPEELKLKALKGFIFEENILKENYLKDVLKLDLSLNKFIERMNKEKWFEKTNILIVSMSGYEILDHGRIGTGTSYYQESILTPFLWIGPNITGKEIKNPLSILDIFPTILKKFNLSYDWKNFEGVEFTPAFQNIFPLDRVFVFKGNELYFKGKAYLKEDKKIIISDGGRIEVYDLQKDPKEKENLFLLRDEKIMKMIEEAKNL